MKNFAAWLAFMPILGGCDQLIHGEGMDAVRSNLIDPDSAKFTSLSKCGNGGLRGEVNSKNAMGGYTGKKSFVYSRGMVGIEGQSDLQYLTLLRDCFVH